MADNPEEALPEIPADAQPENDTGEITPVTDTINPNQATDNMEVHHHAHHGHGKKTWKSYFWEFFMLFMAVFCGSMAELQVEHYIENQREVKYAQSLLEDMKNDTLDLGGDIKSWGRMIKKIDTIRTEIEKPKSERNNLRLYRCVSVITANNSFLYHDRTIQQLKSSGNFRLLRKGNIADSLVEYDAWIQKTLNQIEENFGQIMGPETSTLRSQLFNSKFFGFNRAQLDSAALAEPNVIEIREGKEDILFQFYNHLSNQKGLNNARVFFMKELLRRATNIIEMLKKEYHLE